jgi:UDP-glucose 4-epimerase
MSESTSNLQANSIRSFVIGGAGFIGSHLVDALVERGPVTIYDNMSVGKYEYIQPHLERYSEDKSNKCIKNSGAKIIVGNVLNLETLTHSMAGHDIVYHLSANPEARAGLGNTRLDLEQGTIATYNALEAARKNDVKKFMFASSGTVYGDTPFDCRECDLGNLPISLYGASKLAGEAMISAFCECFGIHAVICRFGNVVGKRATHGAILDFYNKLIQHPDYLDVLGNGNQIKPYLHVKECVKGIIHATNYGMENSKNVSIYNIAPSTTTSVSTIAEFCVLEHMKYCETAISKKAKITYGSNRNGWLGDVPYSRLVPNKLSRLGFHVKHTSDEAVAIAVEEIAKEVFTEPIRKG